MAAGKCVVLLSGGLDSATAAVVAKSREFSLFALTFVYGQRHDVEVEFARKLANFLRVASHEVINLPDSLFKSSSLIRTSGKEILNYHTDSIPTTYVPARNIVFLSMALAYAETINATHIFIGVNAVDYSGYPDCRPEFIEAFQKVVQMGTKSGIKGNPIIIETPLINLTKGEIIKLGISLGMDYSLTSSCYNPQIDGTPCGVCDSCRIRQKGFSEAGIPDPALHRNYGK
ncbi:MAG: 7-cyano-7-deazaguanine synthase QueC [Spirochaetes bacterium]|nr:7-cyano-7-deazaguanine synthase QueC [Spirochaetota bacterium]